MPTLTKEKKRKLRKILGVIKPSEKGSLTLTQFKEDLQDNISETLIETINLFSTKVENIENKLSNEFQARLNALPQTPDLTKEVEELKKEYIQKFQIFTNNLKEDNANIQSQLQTLTENDAKAIKELKEGIKKKIDLLRIDFLSSIFG